MGMKHFLAEVAAVVAVAVAVAVAVVVAVAAFVAFGFDSTHNLLKKVQIG